MTERRPRLPPGYRLLCYDSIGSTNDEAKHLARDGAEEGTLVWALEQSAGHGRRGRAWSSPRGNLYLSLILRPDCPVSGAAQLSFVAALAVGSALRAILTVGSEKLSFVVVGVGVNLIASPPGTEFPASSVMEEGLGEVMPEVMLEEFAEHFRSWNTRWRADGFAPVRASWLAAAAIARGEPIRVRLDARGLCGRFLDIDHEGNLLLDCAGECRRVAAGEVFPAG
jgi:BirA family biotin operon repressor/biotin-[acetyl-CoA-carboxylase] ligase